MKRWAGVSRFGGVGDNLMAASVLRPLKRLGYMTEVITSPPNDVVFLNNPFLDKLSVKNPDTDMPKNDLPGWQAWHEARAREFDVYCHLSHSCEGRHAIFRHMTPFWWRAEYRRKICAGSYLETAHDVAGVPYEFGPLFFPTDEEKDHAAQVKAQIGPRCLAWVISGTRLDKIYPYASMAIGRIIREVGCPIVIIGGSSDNELAMAQAIKAHVTLQNGTRDGLKLALPDGIAGSPQNWSLRTALSFVLGCDLVVAPDTGPSWAVAFEPMPKIIMVSHASVENITKHWVNTTTLHADPDRVPCWPCHRLHEDPSTCVSNADNNGAACISDISVERLVTEVQKTWAQVNGNVVHAERAFAGARPSTIFSDHSPSLADSLRSQDGRM